MLKCLRASQQDIPLELSFFSSQSACFSYTVITKSIQPVVVITFFFFSLFVLEYFCLGMKQLANLWSAKRDTKKELKEQ